MLVVCRLADLSALERHYAGSTRSRNKPMRQWADMPECELGGWTPGDRLGVAGFSRFQALWGYRSPAHIVGGVFFTQRGPKRWLQRTSTFQIDPFGTATTIRPPL
jgi:hypothetical protein